MGTGGTGQIGDPGRGVQVRTEAGTGQEKGGTGLGARTGVRGGGYRGLRRWVQGSRDRAQGSGGW